MENAVAGNSIKRAIGLRSIRSSTSGINSGYIRYRETGIIGFALFLMLFMMPVSGLAQYPVNAPGSFLEKGQDAMAISGGYHRFVGHAQPWGYDMSIDYSRSGVWDAGFSVNRLFQELREMPESVNYMILKPRLARYFFKQSEGREFSVNLSAEYQRIFNSADKAQNVTGNYIAIGPSLYRVVNPTGTLRFQTGLGYRRILGRYTRTHRNMEVMDYGVNTWQARASVTMMYQIPGGMVCSLFASLGVVGPDPGLLFIPGFRINLLRESSHL